MSPVTASSNPCRHWIGAEKRRCEAIEGVRFFIQGYRCPDHTPAAIAGRQEIASPPRLLDHPDRPQETRKITNEGDPR